MCSRLFSVSLLLPDSPERRELENSIASCSKHSVVVVSSLEDKVPSMGAGRDSVGDSTGEEGRNESRLCIGDSRHSSSSSW